MGDHKHRVIDVVGELARFVVADGNQVDVHVAEVDAVTTARRPVLDQQRDRVRRGAVPGPCHGVEIFGDPVLVRKANHH